MNRQYMVVSVNKHTGETQPLYTVNGDVAKFTYEEAKAECMLMNRGNFINIQYKLKRV